MKITHLLIYTPFPGASKTAYLARNVRADRDGYVRADCTICADVSGGRALRCQDRRGNSKFEAMTFAAAAVQLITIEGGNA